MEFDEDLMIPDKSLSIAQGAIAVLGWQSCTDKGSFTRAILDALAEEYQFSLDTPLSSILRRFRTLLSMEPAEKRSKSVTRASGERAFTTWHLKA